MAVNTQFLAAGGLFYSPNGRHGLPTIGYREIGTLSDLVVGEDLVFSHRIDSAADLATPTTAPGTVVYGESVMVCGKAYKLVRVDCFFSVKNTDAAKLQVEKCTGAQLPGQGTDLLTDNSDAGFDLAAAVGTQSGTLTATVADRTFAAGDRLAIVIDATLAEFEDCVITFTLSPVAMDAATDS